MHEILRALALYLAYAGLVGGLLLQLVKPDADQQAAVPQPLPSERVVTLSVVDVVDGNSEASVQCSTQSDSVAADAIAVHSLAELEELFHGLGCGRR